MRRKSEVVIVGAGASGLLCGGLLAEAGILVTILEKNERIGKKLSATGNGRCNFTNLYMDAECYYGDRKWMSDLLAVCGPEKIIQQFQRIGILHRERDGYVYPYTNQAVTVIEALERCCRRGGTEIVTDCIVSGVHVLKGEEGYCVRTTCGEIRCRYLILAAGGEASSGSGGSVRGYALARRLGHTVHKTYPALTGLVCGGSWWKKVAGTRIQGGFALRVNGVSIPGECGEIQIVREGVSGIPVFQLCREAAIALDQGKKVEGVIDFVPPMEQEELHRWTEIFGVSGLVPKKWEPVLEQWPEPGVLLKEFTFPVTGTFGMERAQVTAGGVSTDEVNNRTMESRVAPNVFLLGEILDIDGKCGGYNLHFAWSCAMLAADALIRKIRR